MRTLVLLRVCLAALLAAAAAGQTAQKPTTRAERKAFKKERLERAKEQVKKFEDMKKSGVDMISDTKQAAALRSYELRKKKMRGMFRKREKSLSSILFPGLSPEEYQKYEAIPMNVELVESRKTQVPYKYYDLPVCQPPDESAPMRRKIRRNIGSRLMGSKPQASPYQVAVGKDMGCTPICVVTIGGRKLRWMRKLVDRQYRVQLTLDQLPVLMRSKELNYAVRGHPLGFKAPASFTGLKEDEAYLFNHLKFTIGYHEDDDQFTGARIIGFDVHPVSIQHAVDEEDIDSSSQLSTCNAVGAQPVKNDPHTYLALRSGLDRPGLQVVYSYEVEWVKSDVEWTDRWDVYLVGTPDDDIHYFAIVNSFMIVLFLSGAVATIMIRTLRKDIAGYNEIQAIEEAQEETGWKLIHGDVFRPPSFNPIFLSVAVGTGAQLGVCFFSVLLCCLLKLVNPMRKGQALSSIVMLYVLSGTVSGYCSSRIFKFCDGKAWKRNTVLTASAFPGLVVGMFMFLNVFLTYGGATRAATAVSFWLILAIFLLWICVSTPLVFVGSYLGFRAEKVEVPTKTNQIARYIPEQPFYSDIPFSCLFGGILPFGSVCIELFFMMTALWLHQYFYMMGFLMAVLLILTATCSMVSIVMCYLQLCGEDHRWWWKSFWNCATGGVYMFLYSLWFLSIKLDLVGFLPIAVYLTYMSMISISFGLLCGSIGFFSCFWFTRTIYGAVKVD